MNINILQKNVKLFLKRSSKENKDDQAERKSRIKYYQSWSTDRILNMTEEDLYEYIAKLWAMLIWGNKQYVVDKLIQDNSFGNFKNRLAELVWGTSTVDQRWDTFRKNIKGLGPAMMSEILCHVHPNECMLWNRRAYVGLNYLGISNLPRYNYQLTGKVYMQLSDVAKEISKEIEIAGVENPSLLTVDYFIWKELQVEDNLSNIFRKSKKKDEPGEIAAADKETSDFIHNEIRDKLRDIGSWLGFDTKIEQKVAVGSKVDTVWESTIGNMGRVIYVFEVQTKGSIDSLIINLLKSLNNPAVQGVVAVSDVSQLEKITKHAEEVGTLAAKLKYWDYEEVLAVHASLEAVNASINSLGLVPQGF